MGNPGAPRRHTPQSVLRALRDRDQAEHPVATTGEVAELHGASRPVIKERLEELIERGDVQTAKVGGTDVYWPSDETLVSPAETAARRQHDQEDLSSDIAERVAANVIENLDPEAAEVFKRLDEGVSLRDSDRREDAPSDGVADGGPPAEMQGNEVQESLVDLRKDLSSVTENLNRTHEQLERLEENVAKALSEENEQNSSDDDSEDVVRHAVHEEIHAVRNEWIPHVKRLAVSLVGLLSIVALSIANYYVNFPSSVRAVLGLLFFGVLGYSIYTIFRLFHSVTAEDVASENAAEA